MLPVYGKQIGASVVEIGLFFSAFSLVTVLLRPLVGWALDRFGRRRFFHAGLAGYAVAMFGFAFISQVGGIVLARVFQGIASSLLWLSASAMTADLAGEQERGSAFGRIAQASSRGSIAGTFLGFMLLNAPIRIGGKETPLGSWTALFIVYGAVALIALFLTLPRLPETRPAAGEGEPTPIRWSRPWMLVLLVTLVTGALAAMISPILIIFLQEKLGVGIETLWAFVPTDLVWVLLAFLKVPAVQARSAAGG
jgi:MFS family permease